jgi:hypothetical protein
MSDTATSIVMNNEDRLAKSHNSNFATRFVYITTGNHFALEVLDKKGASLYYVDSVTGEIIVKSNLSKLRS